MQMEKYYDVIIVGTGAAGLYCALNLTQRFRILMLTKQKADESDSFLAQGGICMLRGEYDYGPYFEDTMHAGHYENDRDAVDLMIRSSNSIIRDLVRRGVRFARTKDGELDFTREGAHSRPRILFHEDVTGREITSKLLEIARTFPNIEIMEYTPMLDIITSGNACCGAVVLDDSGKLAVVSSPRIVFASGGIGGLYKNSTNFPHITGDALAMALAHRIRVEHMDYIQIHPTTLYSKKPGRRFLISESVRGEGALLYGRDGRRFTDELQPRDMLSDAIYRQMERDKSDFVWEDMRPLGEETISKHFPNIRERCLEEGYDVLKDPIPVVPAQHYFMGGIKADLAGRTSMPGVYACGETACSGVHGKNRLASNSLLESLVFSQRAADDMIFGPRPAPHAMPRVDLGKYSDTKALYASYRSAVLNEIERERASHE